MSKCTQSIDPYLNDTLNFDFAALDKPFMNECTREFQRVHRLRVFWELVIWEFNIVFREYLCFHFFEILVRDENIERKYVDVTTGFVQ